MSADEFPPLIYCDLVRDEPMTREEFVEKVPVLRNATQLEPSYQAYLERHQPWRLLIKSGDNQEPLFRSTESYFNRADAIHAADLAFGAGSTVFLREREHGNMELRRAVRGE